MHTNLLKFAKVSDFEIIMELIDTSFPKTFNALYLTLYNRGKSKNPKFKFLNITKKFIFFLLMLEINCIKHFFRTDFNRTKLFMIKTNKNLS